MTARLRGSALFLEHAFLLGSFAAGLVAVGLVIQVAGLSEHRGAGIVATPLVVGLAALTYAMAGRQLPVRRPEDPDAGGPDDPPNPVFAERAGWGTTLRVALTHTLLAVAGSIVLSYVSQLLGVTVEEQATVREVTTPTTDGGINPALYFLAPVALLAAPVAEELLFRRYFFHRLLVGVGTRWAYALSAIWFAAIHWNPSGLAIYLWLGLLFAHAYHRTGRITCAILVHFGNNLVTMLLLLAGQGG